MIKVLKKPVPMSEVVRVENLLMAATPRMSREELEARSDAALQPRRRKRGVRVASSKVRAKGTARKSRS